MILLVDAGNSRIKWWLCRAGEPCEQGHVATSAAQDLARLWLGLRPHWVGICNVAGAQVAAAIAEALVDTGTQPFWLAAKSQAHGIRNPYAGLGADRYAALIAARRRVAGPCVVASLGTALTVDALDADGTFLGGLILPGHGLMRAAIERGTAGVQAGEGAYAEFPLDTATAVETGIVTALVGAITAMRDRLARRAQEPVELILTGGDVERVAAHLPGPLTRVDGLVMEGLLCVARDKGVLEG